MNHIEELVNIIKGHKIIIQTHNCPDPDAISSAFGLSILLEHYDIESTLVYDGSLNKLIGIRLLDYLGINLYSVEEAEKMGVMSEDNYVILVDSQKHNKNVTDIIGDEIATIDHHPTVFEAEYLYKDLRITGACASIIASYYEEAGIEIPIEVATALLYGIKIDTADFNRGVTEFDISMFHYLYSKCDQMLLNKLSLNTLDILDLKAYGKAISNISMYKNIAFAHIPFNCPDELVSVVSDFILALDVIDFSVVYSNKDGSYKFSVRSELPELDAGKIIRQSLEILGGGSGGGHSFMAGGFIPQSIVDCIEGDNREAIEKAFITCIYPNDEYSVVKVMEE